MLREVAAGLVSTFVLSWTGPLLDQSFYERMVPVRMAGNSGRVLLVSPVEVTEAEWAHCVHDKGCSHQPRLRGGGASKPVTGINWFDVNEYLAWANARSGGGLRLPTKAEWLWLSRSLAKPLPPPAFTDPRLAWAANYGQEESAEGPVQISGTFSKTPDGIFDLDGNVWEWTASCAKQITHDGNVGACPAFFVEGMHEAVISVFVRDPASGGCATGSPPTHLGFRLVVDRER
jgi:formylglycine-generating enzyme required for sulfatase activity